MKSFFALVATAFLCFVAFPTTTVGKNLRFWPKPIEGWPSPSEMSRNEMMFMKTSHNFNYGDSKVWRCTYSNGSAPAISISPSIPSTPSTPSPKPPTPKTSPSPPTPSPPHPTPKKSPPPPTPKKAPSPPPPTPSLPPPTPKKSPSSPKPTPSLAPPTPKKSPSLPKPTPSLPPPTPKKSPSPTPLSHDVSSSPSKPSNPPPAHHHHHENPWEHIGSCMRNMGPVGICRGQMEFSFFTKMFQVSEYCCNLIVKMKNECDDVIWGYFTDPFFVPLVRCTCHVTY